MDFDTLHFFELQKHPDAVPLYEALEARIRTEVPDVRACPMSGCGKRPSCPPATSW